MYVEHVDPPVLRADEHPIPEKERTLRGPRHFLGRRLAPADLAFHRVEGDELARRLHPVDEEQQEPGGGNDVAVGIPAHEPEVERLAVAGVQAVHEAVLGANEDVAVPEQGIRAQGGGEVFPPPRLTRSGVESVELRARRAPDHGVFREHRRQVPGPDVLTGFRRERPRRRAGLEVQAEELLLE